jgi:hypothetical protein
MSMKLYLWEGVLCDYTAGVMFALAESADEARELIRKDPKWIALPVSEEELKTRPKVLRTDRPFGFHLYGGG